MDKIYREAMGLSSHERFSLGGYGYENIAFLQILIDNKVASPSLEDAKKAHIIVNACYLSSQNQKKINIWTEFEIIIIKTFDSNGEPK